MCPRQSKQSCVTSFCFLVLNSVLEYCSLEKQFSVCVKKEDTFGSDMDSTILAGTTSHADSCADEVGSLSKVQSFVLSFFLFWVIKQWLYDTYFQSENPKVCESN